MAGKLLIIDDDTRIHGLVKMHFKQHPFEITSAYSGSAGLNAAREQRPDVVLLDVDIRESQGFEVCRQLKADPATRSIPVIFLSAASSVESRIFGLECGASDYLTKPFHPLELQARVRAAMRTKSQLDEASEHRIHDELI